MIKEKSNKIKIINIKELVILFILILITATLLIVFPEHKQKVIKSSLDIFYEMITILPGVMILMGLFSVFVSKEMIVKYLGKSAGIKAILLGIFMGALPTGPMYVAFPIASTLRKKGASISSIVSFLSAWACIKIPQEIVELQFLGFKFMIARLSLTIIFVVIIAYLIEHFIEKQ